MNSDVEQVCWSGNVIMLLNKVLINNGSKSIHHNILPLVYVFNQFCYYNLINISNIFLLIHDCQVR